MAVVFAPPNNKSSFIQQLLYANELTDVGQGGVLGIGIIFAIFAGVFLITKAFSFEKSLSAAALIASFTAFLLRILGLVSDGVFYIFLIILIISLFFLFRGSDDGI